MVRPLSNRADGAASFERFGRGANQRKQLMYTFRNRFPLHYVVFKQTASHLPHEANVEQVFSRAGRLADPNMNPNFLATLVRVGINKKNYKPSVQAIKELYYGKYRGSSAGPSEE